MKVPDFPIAAKAGIVLALVAVTALICVLAPDPKAGDESGVSMQLPESLDGLNSYAAEVSQAEHDILPADTRFERKTYGLPGSNRLERILCSIVLSGNEKRSIHRPERCLPAQGWRIDSAHVVTIPLASGHNLDTTALLLERPIMLPNQQPSVLRCYFLYWFVGKDVSTASNTKRILLTNWDLLFHRVSQRWAYVTVSANILDGVAPGAPDADATLKNLKRFIHDSVPYYVKSEMNGNTVTAVDNGR